MMAALILLAFVLGIFAGRASRNPPRHYGLPPLPDDEITGIGA